MAILNIGLDTPDGGTLAWESALNTLQRHGVPVALATVVPSASEDTLVVLAPRDGIPHDVLHAISEELCQECVAYWDSALGLGTLVGPEAAKWGSFDAGYFYLPGGGTLAEVLCSRAVGGTRQ